MSVMAKSKPRRNDPKPEEKPSPDTVKKPKRTGRSLSVWLPTELRDALDAYIEAQRFPPQLTDIVQESIEKFLLAEGWPLPTYEQPEGGVE